MGKRKVFVKTDLGEPRLDCGAGRSTTVDFPKHVHSGRKSFDFGPWYGVSIDQITQPCHEQVVRFLAKQDHEVEQITVIRYCEALGKFLTYAHFYARVQDRNLCLDDVDREMIDGFLEYLAGLYENDRTQKAHYKGTKAVFLALAARGKLKLVQHGDEATFRRNAFPNSSRFLDGGEKPLSPPERKRVAIALRAAVLPVFDQTTSITSELLTYALLNVALHTGRNTTPLLEMPPDTLVDHPKNDRKFMFLDKRRGSRVYKAPMRKEVTKYDSGEEVPTVGPGLERLLTRVIDATADLRAVAPRALQRCVWLYQYRKTMGGGRVKGTVAALSEHTMGRWIKKLVRDHDLRDDEGNPLRLNVSRLRKTFTGRIFELTGGDIVLTAAAAGNTPKVAASVYLLPTADSATKWRFMGEMLVEELRTGTIGATERTPVGRCTDVKNGEFSPASKSGPCTSFLNCVRCRNYVVTADDLYRVFSFYWRVLSERARMPKQRWEKSFAHIIRLIDRDVAESGIKRGYFKRAQIDAARDRARVDPHPFWSAETLMDSLEAMA